MYFKSADRKAVDFALVSLAVRAVLRKNRIETIRLVLGGAASMPWRLRSVEDYVVDRDLNETAVQAAADMAVEGATPASRANGKVRLIKGLVGKALLWLSAAR